jgi:glycosyltransferase involved in cell wall biosynthesis
MAEKLISVVVPTLNRANCLGNAVDSILSQTYQNVEVIVVDDGSTDNTRELIERCYETDARVKYTFQENQGVTAARNRGLQLAQGEFVALLDSDDTWVPWKLQLQLACFERCPQIGLVWTDMEAVAPDGSVVDQSYLRTMYHAYRWFTNEQLFSCSYPIAQVAPQLVSTVGSGTLFTGDIFSQMVMGNLVHTSTVILRRELLDRVQGYNEELWLGEDYDFHLRICKEGPVGFLNLATIRYQTGMADQITRDRGKLLQVAKSCLKTILPVLEHDRDRIRLPAWMIKARLAEVHEWIGEVALEIGRVSDARRHLFASLCHQPLQARALCLLAVSGLPFGIGTAAKKHYRLMKARIRFTPSVAR